MPKSCRPVPLNVSGVNRVTAAGLLPLLQTKVFPVPTGLASEDWQTDFVVVLT